MTEKFAIDDIILAAELNPVQAASSSFKVKSVPFPYSIEWLGTKSSPSTMINRDETARIIVQSNRMCSVAYMLMRNIIMDIHLMLSGGTNIGLNVNR